MIYLGCIDLRLIPLTTLLAPFFAIIRSPLSTGPITSAALSALHSFFLCDLISPNAAGLDHALIDLSSTVSRCKFEASDSSGDEVVLHQGFQSKDVWGNEDPRRKEREQARITSSDPFAFMQKAQVQLKRSKEDKRRWADERERDLRRRPPVRTACADSDISRSGLCFS